MTNTKKPKFTDWKREDLEDVASDYFELVEFLHQHADCIPDILWDSEDLHDKVYRRYEP